MGDTLWREGRPPLTLRITACTICARNYLAQARVFATSLREQHPEARVVTLILDDTELADWHGEPFEVVRPEEILPANEFARMCTAYGIVELATAVKPSLLLHLLKTADVAAYFDPDIQFHGAINDVFRLAVSRGIVLTPHSVDPLPGGGHATATEDIVLDAGVFNLGFIAVGQTGIPAIRWWDQKLRRECIIDPPRARFVDQRWVDLVPAYFGAHIERDPGLNVAWWNLPTRDIRLQGETLQVNGAALRFIHFSGYDVARPWMLSVHQGPIPRVLLSEEPVVRQLASDYRSALLEAGYETASCVPYGLARSPEGLEIDPRMRRLYREALVAAERDGTLEPPRLFDQTDGQFLEWLASPDEPSGGPWPQGRYIHALWLNSAELQAAFPDPHGANARELRSWATTDAVAEGLVPAALAGMLAQQPPPDRQPIADGVHLIVARQGSPAHGLIADDIVASLLGAGIDVTQTDVSAVGRDRPSTPHGEPREVNVFVVPPMGLGAAMHVLQPEHREAAINVAVIFSQAGATSLPREWLASLDEIWVLDPSRAKSLALLPAAPEVTLLPLQEPPQGPGRLLVIDCAVASPSDVQAASNAMAPGAEVIALQAHHATETLEYIKWAVEEQRFAGWSPGDLRSTRALMAAGAAFIQVGGDGDPPVPPLPGDDFAAFVAGTANRSYARTHGRGKTRYRLSRRLTGRGS